MPGPLYGQPAQPPTTFRTWEEIVREADGPDYDRERKNPIVYEFPPPGIPRREKDNPYA